MEQKEESKLLYDKAIATRSVRVMARVRMKTMVMVVVMVRVRRGVGLWARCKSTRGDGGGMREEGSEDFEWLCLCSQ